MKSQFKKTSRLLYPIFLLTLFVLFTGLTAAKAAVAVDSSSNSAAFDGIVGVSTLTWSHTVGTGDSRALFVGVSTASTNVNSATARVGSVTYGAQTLTRVTGGFQVSPDLNNAVELFQLVSPNVGTDTITVNLLPTAANYVVGGSVSFTGVNQATPNGTFVSTTNALGVPSNTATVAVSDSVAGDLVLDVLGTSFNAQNVIPNASQTRQWRLRRYTRSAAAFLRRRGQHQGGRVADRDDELDFAGRAELGVGRSCHQSRAARNGERSLCRRQSNDGERQRR